MAERNYLPQFMVRGKIYSPKARKPPGGDTNDIFGLEKRQKERKVVIYADKRMETTAALGDKLQKKYHETEDIPTPRTNSGRKVRRSLSESRTGSRDRSFRTPPLATGKENIGSHFKESLSPASKINLGGKILDENETDDETSTPKKHQACSPNDGDVVDSSSCDRSKLEDSTNITKDETPEPFQQKVRRRPCIRVRQPPGGKSSIIF